MIVLDNNIEVNIPNYDDLENKPSINGVVLEGNKTASELGIEVDTTNFYTKGQADGKFQQKGNYLTSVPSQYITDKQLNSRDYATNSDVMDEIGKLESALEGDINSKQDKLVSGENIKTINGISLLGDGNIVITGSGEGGSVDLSDYYTKSEVDNLIDNVEVDLTDYATTSYVNNNFQPKGNYQPKGDYLTEIPADYVTDSELEQTLNDKDYATKSEIPTIPTNVSDFTNDAGYITENYVEEYYQPKGSYLTSVPSEYVTESELNAKGYATTTQVNVKQDKLISGTNIKSINGLSLVGGGNIQIETDLSDYYTKGEVNEAINDISTNLADNYYTISEVDELIESAEPDLAGYATESWVGNHYQPKGSYLTSVPSEYVTETELNDALAGKLDIPYVIITAGNIGTAVRVLSGDLSAVLAAFREEKPFIAYFYTGTGYEFSDYSEIGEANTYYPLRLRYVKGYSGYNEGGYFSYSTEYGENNEAMDVRIEFDRTGKLASTVTEVKHNYLTKTYYDNYVAPLKQDKLISGTNIKTINGNSILGSGDITIEGGGSDVPYIVVKDDGNNSFSIASGNVQSVFDAYNNNKPYLIYLPNGIGAGYYSLAETVQVSGSQLQALSFAHTGTTHTWRYWRIYNDGDVNLYNEISLNYATTTQLNSKQDTLVAGTNIKTINGESILGEGNLTIEGGGTTDLTGYATESWVSENYYSTSETYSKLEIDSKIGNINTILENIIG